MLRIKKVYIILIFFLTLAFTIPSNAEEEIEDLIDIFESDSKIIAVIEGKKTISFDLRAKEKVVWSASKGFLGAFLTNHRFFITSVASGSWKYFHLRSGEFEEALASMSSNIVLLVFDDRAIGYDSSANKFVETRLPLRDKRLFVETGNHVAVVITSSLAIGFTEKSSFFSEIRIRNRESIENVKVTSNKIIVRTTDRLLSFTSRSSAWKEHRL